MLLWRFEDEAGKGFYRSDNCKEWNNGFQDTNRNHPMPWKEKSVFGLSLDDLLDSDFIFGFSSIRKARQWFNDPKLCSQMDGPVILAAYDKVRKVYHGQRQSIFVPVDVKRRATLKPSQLHTLPVIQLTELAQEQLRNMK